MIDNPVCQMLGIDVPLFCGAMYPCSNPELVAAVSAAGGMGVVQPMSLSYVHGHDFRAGLRLIRSLTDKPIGLNLIIESSSKTYLKRTHDWASIALEEGVECFVTALGDPKWVVDMASGTDTIIFHDVTNARFAEKAFNAGVDGFIAVNKRAGGHAGKIAAKELLAELQGFEKPVICAGGLGTADDFRDALAMGYSGAQLGTRFIASTECTAHADYKQAIIAAGADDIVLTERLTGVPVAIINTPAIQKIGTRAGLIARMMLKGRKTRHWMRTIYSLQSIWKLKKANLAGSAYQDYWQAGKSAGGIHEIKPAADIVSDFRAVL